MSNPGCPNCQRTSYMFLSKCRSCGELFCDDCGEAAAQLSDAVMHSSETVTMYQPVCPKCSSKDVDIGVKE